MKKQEYSKNYLHSRLFPQAVPLEADRQRSMFDVYGQYHFPLTSTS
jgi:hypothetical protein